MAGDHRLQNRAPPIGAVDVTGPKGTSLQIAKLDGKSQIQALDRTQPGLPMKKGRAGTMTHDYIRGRYDHTVCRIQCRRRQVIARCMML